MMSYVLAILTRSVVATLVACALAPANAQSVADFYKGKNVAVAIASRNTTPRRRRRTD
jgi:hypothetical protein